MGRRRRKPTWQDALAAGRGSVALYRWLMVGFGEGYSLWLGGRADVEQRILDRAVAFCGEHGVDVRWACAGSRPVRAVLEYVVGQWKPHLAHWKLGAPRKPFVEWTAEERAMRHVGGAEAEAQLRLKVDRQRMYAQQAAQAEQVKAYQRKLQARAMHADGFQVEEIQETLRVSRSTVYGYLSGS